MADGQVAGRVHMGDDWLAPRVPRTPPPSCSDARDQHVTGLVMIAPLRARQQFPVCAG